MMERTSAKARSSPSGCPRADIRRSAGHRCRVRDPRPRRGTRATAPPAEDL